MKSFVIFQPTYKYTTLMTFSNHLSKIDKINFKNDTIKSSWLSEGSDVPL